MKQPEAPHRAFVIAPPALAGALATILAIGCVLRVWGLQAQSFSMDEIYELTLAKASPTAIIGHADGLPPLYHLLLHEWLPLFGGDASARWLSVVAGVVTVWVMWKLGAQLAGTAAGLAAASLLTISPIHIYYSQEARCYGLLVLWAVLAIWFFLRARGSDARRDWAAFWAVSLLGLCTHYYFSLLLIGLIVSLLAEGASRLPLRRMVLAFAFLAVAALPLAWLAVGDLELQKKYPDPAARLSPASLAYTLFTFLGGYSLGPSLSELHVATARQAALEVLPWAVTLGSAAAYFGYLALTGPRWRRPAWALLLMIAVPLALCGLLGWLLGIGYRVRYVSWAAAPLLALIALGIVRRPDRWLTRAGTLVLVAVSLVAIHRRHSVPRYMTEDSRSAAQWLAANVDSSDPIFVSSDYMRIPLSYYAGEDRELRVLPHVTSSARLRADLDSIRSVTAAGEPFWLVYSRPFHGDPKGMLLRDLRERTDLRLRATLPGFEIYQGRGF